MKIRAITPYILKVPLGDKQFYSSQCSFPERNSLLVKVETDEGVYGWGEGGQYGPAEAVKTCIDTVLAPMLIGADPLDKGALWHKMYNGTRDFGQKGAYVEAISAIDIALWDICGKYLGVPASKLLGGRQRDKVGTYATGCYYQQSHMGNVQAAVRDMQAEAQRYVESGFKMLKIKVGLLSVEDDAKRVAAIRSQVGEDVKLFVDCNHAYNGYTAVRMGRYLEENNILFMEEPVPPEDHEGYRHVRSRVDIAIAGGECEYTAFGFKRLFTDECVDIAQPDICVCGGLSEFQRILALAHTFGVTVMPHVWGSGIALAAALSALAGMPMLPHTANPIPFQNDPLMEYDRNINPLRDELLTQPMQLADSMVSVPTGNGLGVDVDPQALEKYRV